MKRMIRTPLVRLVDDDDAFRESQREFLKAMGWQVEDYAGAAEAWASVETERWRSLAAPWRAEVKFLLS